MTYRSRPFASPYSLPVTGRAGTSVFGGSDAGECEEPIVKFTWPSSVDEFKARLDTVFVAVDASVRACPGMQPGDRDAWASFVATWRTFLARKTPLFGSSSEWEQTCGYAKMLDKWQERIATTGCQLLGPGQIEGRKNAPQVMDLARLLAYGAIGIGAVTLLVIYAPEIKALLPGKR